MKAKRYCAVALGLTLVSCVEELLIVADPDALVVVPTEWVGQNGD